MIRYALICSDCDAEFEAWFSNSASFDDQKKRGLVECAVCSGRNVGKAIMAPSIKRTDKPADSDPSAITRNFIKRAKRHIAENFDYVGDKFADEARAIHKGETVERAIWGQASPAESAALVEEGVDVLPLPGPLTPDIPKSEDELN